MSRLSGWFGVFPAIAFSLGSWQVHRYQWKQGELALRESRRIEPVSEWRDDLNLEEREFTRVRVRGEFDHALEVQSGPRSFDGNSGRFVLTPFRLESGKRVLINRGWVSRDADMSSIVRPEGEIELVGVVRKSEKQGRFVPPNDGKTFFWLDQASLNQVCKCDFPLRLDAVKSSNPASEPPIGGQTVYWMPNNHASYIAT